VLIRIRKENFGYVLFDRHGRTHHFVKTDEVLEDKDRSEIVDFLGKYYAFDTEPEYEILFPPKNALELAAPIALYLEISPMCNLHCQHCYKPVHICKHPLSTQGFKDLIDELSTLGVFEIRFCGNEPTVHPDFFEICRFVQDRQMYLGINTNAHFDSAFQQRLVELGPDFVVVSIDGTEDTHDQIRGAGSYQLAVSFLQALARANIKRRINTVLSSDSLPAVRHIAKLADETGSDVSYLPLRPIGKATSFKKNRALTPELMMAAVNEVMEVRSRYPNVTFLTYFDIYSAKPTYHHSLVLNEPCPARKNGFVTCEGDFYPCDFLRAVGNRFLCGNIAQSGFWKI
jgi:MoaA/NifB/PqqE/SkfB family radical SAM enzyme